MTCLAPPSTVRPVFRSLSAVLLLMFSGLFQITAQAQSQYCLGGDLEHLTATQRTACNAKLAEVRTAARHFGAPVGWHFVMVCGEDNWKAYAPFSTRPAKELEAAAADTDLAAHTTYLREARLQTGGSLLHGDANFVRTLAAIVLGTADEAAIEAKVNSWVAAADVKDPPVLQASRSSWRP